MEREEHKNRIERWHELGKKLGYESFKEYSIDNSRDSIDCVWKNASELVFIEVEMNGYSNQVWKNLTKGLHLKPTKIIFDCNQLGTANKIEELRKRVDCRVEVIDRGNAVYDLVSLKESLKSPIFLINNFYQLGKLETFSTLVESFEASKENYDGKWLKIQSTFFQDVCMYIYLHKIGYLTIKDFHKWLKSTPKDFYVKLNNRFNGKIMGVPVHDIVKCNFKNINTHYEEVEIPGEIDVSQMV